MGLRKKTGLIKPQRPTATAKEFPFSFGLVRLKFMQSNRENFLVLHW